MFSIKYEFKLVVIFRGESVKLFDFFKVSVLDV